MLRNGEFVDGLQEREELRERLVIPSPPPFTVSKALESGAAVVTGDPEYKAVSKIIEILG